MRAWSIVKDQIKIARADSGKPTGKVLLAAAWTTKEESARFKRQPYVSSWDVTEGTNRECRGLFLGLNYGADMVSNVHTSVFIPSNQRWVFQWVAKIAIRKLHGDKTVDRIQMNIFDQAPNEYGPFLSHTSALLRLCWYHRGQQKTTGFKGLADTPEAKASFKDFCDMCEAISDDVESEEEYELVLELTRMMVEKMHKDETFSTGLVEKINKQLDAIDSNKKHIANHYFRDIFHLFKRTTTANEVRHRNIKYGDDRVTPSSSLAESSCKQNDKRETTNNAKRQREAAQLGATSLWSTGIDHVTTEGARVFFGRWQSRTEYAHVRIDKDTWLVMCPNPKKKTKEKVPQFHRCRTVRRVDGKHLECDCNFMANFGMACPHILNVTNEVHESCWHVRWWKDYNFWYCRDGTSDADNKLWESLAFENPVYPGVLYDGPDADQYPVLSDPAVPVDAFLKVKDSPKPVVLNYSPEMIDTALARIAAKLPPAGMSQEVTYAKGHIIDDADDFDFGGGDEDDDYDDRKPAAEEPIYHQLLPHVKEISKREDQLTDEMRVYIDRQMAKLAMEAQSNAAGKFHPQPMDEDGGMEMEDGMDVDGGWTSLNHATDTRSQDERILSQGFI